MSSVISIKNLDVSFGKKKILNNINLEIEQGEFIGVIGPNAAGKTTLIKSILGLVKATSGSVKIFDEKPEKIRQRVGYVAQKPVINHYFPITVNDAIMLGTVSPNNYYGRYTAEDIRKTSEIISVLGLGDIADKQLTVISGGQLQRVWLARALVSEPDILILDEPTANIDVIAEENIFALLKEFNSKMTIIVISHDVAFISSYVDRVACVNQSLICHDIESINGKTIEELYGIDVSMIHHHH